MSNGKHAVALFFCCTVAGALSYGQTSNPAPSSSYTQGGAAALSSSQSAVPEPAPPPQIGDASFQGSVPQGAATPNPIPLSFADAIERGLRTNLGLLTSQQSSNQIRAERYRALSALLPNLNGQLSMTEQQLNLQALGFLIHPPPQLGFTIPNIVGPYSYQAVQVNASIPVFDYTAINNFRSLREDVKASALSVKNARDLVVEAVGNAYLQIIADAARITATQAEIDADTAVYNNAVRRHNAGTAIGIDVLRSQVELKQRQQQLVAVTNQFEKDKLTLGRVIGLPVGQDFTTADPSPSIPLESISLQDAEAKAYANRPDYQAARARALAAQFALRAARAERYPTLTISGFYGDEGLRLFSNSHGVFNVTGSLQFNIFDGGRIRGDILQSESELTNRRNELANLRGQIDYEVRNALLDLKSSGDQVEVATSNMDLANQSLKESRDRFAAGVTNTVEVVQAQQAVAEANENLISARYQYNLAKVSLARALGLAEEGIRAYFNKQP
ncbi:MAG: TolC family protein [Acidobacteriaceae bacterium]|nr:TolC family protein [Acidobacteriaceae bacterium]MBV9501362.1 TolC family protein [Acidobacteriaceae bacterium]